MKTIDADTILARATPAESVENLNQLEVPVQLSRLLHAHEIVLKEGRTMARLAANSGDDGSNDLIVSDVIRRNELQAWFLAEHVVNTPLTDVK